MKKRGITFVKLEMPVIAQQKVCLLVLNLYGFQYLVDVQNPPDLTYQQILFSPLLNVALFFSAIATPCLKKQRGKQKASEDYEDSNDTCVVHVLTPFSVLLLF